AAQSPSAVLPDPMPITPDPANLVNRIASLPPLYRQRHYRTECIHLNQNGSNLDHGSQFHNARLSATNSAVPTPLSSIFIRPRGPSNSTTAPGRVPNRGAIS